MIMNSPGAVLSPALLNTIPIVIEMKQNKQFPRELVETNPESGSSISVQRTDLSISCGPEQEPQNGEKNNERRWWWWNRFKVSGIGKRSHVSAIGKGFQVSGISHLPDIHRRPRHA
jgi:hypothetical protein